MRTPLATALLALTAIGFAGADDNPTLEEIARLQVERLRAIEDIQFEGTVFVPLHDPARTDLGEWRPFRMVFAGERYLVSREVSTFWGIDHEIAVFDGRDGWHIDPIHRIVHLEHSQREVFERYNPLAIPHMWMRTEAPRFDLTWLQTVEPDWPEWSDVTATPTSHEGEPALRCEFDVGQAGGPPSVMSVTFASGGAMFPLVSAAITTVEVRMGPMASAETHVSVEGSVGARNIEWFNGGGLRIPLATEVGHSEGGLFGSIGVRISPDTVRINEGMDDSLFEIEPPRGGYLVYDVFEGVFVSDPVEEEAHREMMRFGLRQPAATPAPRGRNWRALAVRYAIPLLLVFAIGVLALFFRPGEDDL
jgi:hypothetical protein